MHNAYIKGILFWYQNCCEYLEFLLNRPTKAGIPGFPETNMKNQRDSIFKRLKVAVVLPSIIVFLFMNGFPSAAAGPSKITYGSTSGIETKFLDRINRERRKRGLRPLSDNRLLSRVSLRHSIKMAEEAELSHTFPSYQSLRERLQAAGLLVNKAGENIAYCKAYLLDIVHDGFMESPSHRDNILDPDFTHCSIKVVKKDRDIYITQEFARLVTPLRQYGTAPEIEKDLAAWFKKKFRSNLTMLPAAGSFAEFCARENLRGGHVPEFNKKWGRFYVVNLIAPEIEALKKELRKRAKHIKFQGAAVGVVTGAHPQYPGGAYSVSALLFPGNKFGKTSEGKLIRYVLKEVNKIRSVHGCRALMYDKSLSKSALETAQLYYNYPEDSLRYPYAQKVRIFRSSDPRAIPSEFTGFLIDQKQSGKVGLAVFAPLKYGLPGNFFIVAIIVDHT